MYDTVSALLAEVPARVMDERLWTRERSSFDPDTGEVHRTRFLNVAKGPLLTLHDGGRLMAERSLPKALWGNNVSEFETGREVVAALACVDEEIRSALGDGLPSFGDWLPCRVDYCRNEHLGDDGAVLRTLGHLAQVELPYKGRPVVGSSGSVNWPHGEVRLKVYSKFMETKGDPRAAGVLRWEAGVMRARGLRNLMAGVGIGEYSRPAASQAIERSAGVLDGFEDGCEEPEGLSVRDVLVPEMSAAALGRYSEFLGGAYMTADELSNVAIIRELAACFGWAHTARLLGWAAVYRTAGVGSKSQVLASSVGSQATRYRFVKDMRTFAAHLRAVGLGDGIDADEECAVDDVIARLAELAA